MGIIMGIGGILIDQFYAKWDYWNPVFILPNIPFEDFYYGFVLGGISAEFYEIILPIKEIQESKKPKKGWLILSAILTVAAFFITVNVLSINSIIAHILPPLMIGILIAFPNKNLLIFECINGISVSILTFLMFQALLLINPNLFENYWIMENLNGLYVLNIPIEELVFAFALGFGTALFYETIFNIKFHQTTNPV